VYFSVRAESSIATLFGNRKRALTRVSPRQTKVRPLVGIVSGTCERYREEIDVTDSHDQFVQAFVERAPIQVANELVEFRNPLCTVPALPAYQTLGSGIRGSLLDDRPNDGKHQHERRHHAKLHQPPALNRTGPSAHHEQDRKTLLKLEKNPNSPVKNSRPTQHPAPRNVRCVNTE